MITEIIPSHHTDSVLCCSVHPNRNLIISGDEDGRLCFTDLTARSPIGRLQHGDGDAIPSVCYNPIDEHSTFAAAGSSILRLDLRKNLGEEAILDTFRINTDEINSIDVDSTGSWIAAGDDSGEVQIISLKSSTAATSASSPAYRTLRRGHTNICNAVTFRPSKPNEILSGGLDCRMVRWDFSKLRQLSLFDMNAGGSGGGVLCSLGDSGQAGNQFCNPPMINSLAVCRESNVEFPSLVAVARGDGCVALYNGDAKASSAGDGGGGGGGKGSNSKSSKGNKKQSSGKGSETGNQGKDTQQGAQERPSTALCWAAGTHQGGHTAAVNCVSFVHNTVGKKLLSVGNDRKVCLWDWQNALEPVDQVLHRAKINWVCSSSGGGGGVDAVMADVAGKLVAISFKE